MKSKIVLITGAGFSAPARLPIQDKILNKMTEQRKISFLDETTKHENLKFLRAFIKVGLFLLNNYAAKDYTKSYTEFKKIEQKYNDGQAFKRLLLECERAKQSIGAETINELIKRIIPEERYYAVMSRFCNNIRKELELCKLEVSLEDIFTSFDKSSITKEYMQKYSYFEMDDIRQAIMRLFVFYFSESVKAHNFSHSDYTGFIRYIKRKRNPITLITTNWDTLIEGYFRKSNIPFDLCLNNDYFVTDDDSIITNQAKSDKCKIIKLHGSINWFRCMHCNTLSIINQADCGNYLFEDSAKEQCIACRHTASSSGILLQPEIITPTMIKCISSQLYTNLWSAASRELMYATNIIFIGYSLPMADYEFRYMIQRSVSPRSKINVVLYKDDNPQSVDKNNKKLLNLLPEKRYRDLFPKNDVSFYYKGFGSYFK